jgi:hypothetical protein
LGKEIGFSGNNYRLLCSVRDGQLVVLDSQGFSVGQRIVFVGHKCQKEIELRENLPHNEKDHPIRLFACRIETLKEAEKHEKPGLALQRL